MNMDGKSMVKRWHFRLMKNPIDVVELNPEFFDGNLMRMGGTFLGSNNKGNPFGTIEKDGKKLKFLN